MSPSRCWRWRASRTEAKNVDFIEADASLYPFGPEFDLIFSRFGVMFFDDPVAAFANIRKAAAKAGAPGFRLLARGAGE